MRCTINFERKDEFNGSGHGSYPGGLWLSFGETEVTLLSEHTRHTLLGFFRDMDLADLISVFKEALDEILKDTDHQSQLSAGLPSFVLDLSGHVKRIKEEG